MHKYMNWGILSTGNIASVFAEDLKIVKGARLYAVGSRFFESAEAFAKKHHIKKAYGNYEDLAQDPDIDVIYIATPHHLHYENTLLCLNAGKHVLCEKPLAVNTAQVQEMIDTAEKHGLFLMEAIWTRFFPGIRKFLDLIRADAIGSAEILNADFGFTANPDPQGRHLNPDLAGGALLDIGIYPLFLSQLVFGPPTEISSMVRMGDTGVDASNAIMMRHKGGELSYLNSTFMAHTAQEAVLSGPEGNIRINQPWWNPGLLTISKPGKPQQQIKIPYKGRGYCYEAEEVMKMIQSGKIKHPDLSWQFSLDLVQTMDKIRAQWKFKYPFEE